MGEIHELFVLALSLVWFAGATPERDLDMTLARDLVATIGVIGPLNRLNAILSLLQALDRYRTPSAIGAFGRP